MPKKPDDYDDEEIDIELDDNIEDVIDDVEDDEEEEDEEDEIELENENENEDEYEDVSEEEERILYNIPNDNVINFIKKENRISRDTLTKYEMVRIIGERTAQLVNGAKPLIKNHEKLSYEKIAIEELKLNMTPFIIKRLLPNNKYELWYLDELKKEHLLFLLN
jgi:DNA-directed RNA polymerase subunit K/omega